GHTLRLLDDAKAPNCQKNNGFNGLGNYSEWPKVAGAVIQAASLPPPIAGRYKAPYNRCHNSLWYGFCVSIVESPDSYVPRRRRYCHATTSDVLAACGDCGGVCGSAEIGRAHV